LIWFFGIDGPHVWATASRTYFDRQERHRLGSLLWVVAPAMLIGPVMVAVGAGGLFYILAISWLHFHIAKQHFGFVMLYKHKARERDPIDFRLDRGFLLTSLMLPFGRFVMKTIFASLYVLQPVQILDTVLLSAYALLALAFVFRQFQKWRAGSPLNTPKLMLLAAVVPLQWLAFEYAASTGPDGVMRAGIILGLFHSFQYHRLMWFHNRNHYSEPQHAEDSGVAGTLARRFVYYFAAAVLLNFLLQLVPSLRPSAYVNAAVWGIPFTHYILDSKIWRVRGNRELAAALRLT
jgi:hypothetical protein